MTEQDLVAFCRREHGRLVGLLSLYCGDAALAEELAQDALARVCRDWRRVRKMAYPEAWASRVALNFANSYFRRKGAERRARERLAADPVTASDPDTALAVSVRHAVASLPPRQRTALLLHYFCDLPFAQVAELMGSPEPTVKSLARRGIERLRSPELLGSPEEAPNAV